jgi:hypothetical protein
MPACYNLVRAAVQRNRYRYNTILSQDDSRTSSKEVLKCLSPISEVMSTSSRPVSVSSKLSPRPSALLRSPRNFSLHTRNTGTGAALAQSGSEEETSVMSQR